MKSHGRSNQAARCAFYLADKWNDTSTGIALCPNSEGDRHPQASNLKRPVRE